MSEPNTWHKPYRYERPIANEFGRLRQVGDRLVCHLCGRDWLNLGIHAWLTHGMTADEYRAEFGLNRTTPLASLSVRRKLSENSSRLFWTGRSGLQPRDAEGMRELQAGAHPEARLERRITQSLARGGAKLCPKGHVRDRKPSGGLVCRACVRVRPPKPPPFYGPPKPRSLVGDLCPNGHPWDGYMQAHGDRNPQRRCRQCNRDIVKRWRVQHPDRFKAQRARHRAAKRAIGSELVSLEAQCPSF